MGDVGYDDGGGSFTSVPVQIDEGAVAGGEIIVTIEDGREDDKDTEGENAAKNKFSLGYRMSAICTDR